MASNPGTSIAKYGSYTVEAAEAEKEQTQGAGGRFVKLAEGRNIVRFIPPPVGRNTPFVLTHQHVIEVPGIANPVSFNCPRVMAKSACPACQKLEALRATGKPADHSAAGKLFPRPRIYANVIVRAQPELGPQILAFGKTIHDQLTDLRADPAEGGDFTDPTDDGFDVVITRTGTGLNTKYTVKGSRNSSPLGDFEWIAQQPNLDFLAKIPTMEEIREMMDPAGTSAAPRARGQEAAQPAPTGGGRRRRGPAVEDDAEAVDDE